MKRENSETGEADSSDDDGEDYDIDNIKMMTPMRNKQKGLNCEQQCPQYYSISFSWELEVIAHAPLWVRNVKKCYT